VVVDAGFTLVEPLANAEVKVPGVMVTLAVPVVTQLRELVEPKLIVTGAAVNEVMVGFAAFTVKLRETAVAAAQVALPACEAWIVQVPGVRNVAVVPLTVQTPVVCEANVTVRSEVAVADSVRDIPTACVTGVLNEIVCGSGSTVKLRETGAAAAQMLLPACEAWMVQVPAATKLVMKTVAGEPFTVQTPVVSEAKLTARPELAEAESVSSAPAVWVPGVLNVIVCGSGFTVKLCDTGVAAAQELLPDCEAWIMQVPAVANVAVVPLTVHTVVVCVAKLTAKPELAVADRVSAVPAVCVPGELNVIDCGCKGVASTAKLRETGVAAAQVSLPACEAWIVQVPGVPKVAVVPLIVQAPVVWEANATVKPELAVADSARDVPTVCVAGAWNVIVCGFSWVSVTFAVPVRREAVALITTVGEAGIVVGAVNKPVALIVPAEADHVTPVETVAVNCWVPPSATLAVGGDTSIATRRSARALAASIGVTTDWPISPHASRMGALHENRRRRNNILVAFFLEDRYSRISSTPIVEAQDHKLCRSKWKFPVSFST
jgi:hypothetical protein